MLGFLAYERRSLLRKKVEHYISEYSTFSNYCHMKLILLMYASNQIDPYELLLLLKFWGLNPGPHICVCVCSLLLLLLKFWGLNPGSHTCVCVCVHVSAAVHIPVGACAEKGQGTT